jgi:hypothetical protein
MQSPRMHRVRRITAAGILTSTMLVVLYLAAPTLGAPAHSGGAIQVFVKPNLSGAGGGSILITGAIGDHGKGVQANAAGKPDSKGRYQLLKLHRGTILINTHPLNKKLNKLFSTAKVNKATCSIDGSVSATIPIISGTRAYAGVSGSVRVKFTFAELARRYASGAKKGRCNFNGSPAAQWATVTGKGTVSFS